MNWRSNAPLLGGKRELHEGLLQDGQLVRLQVDDMYVVAGSGIVRS